MGFVSVPADHAWEEHHPFVQRWVQGRTHRYANAVRLSCYHDNLPHWYARACYCSCSVKRSITLITLSGFSDIESMPHSNRNWANSG